MRIALNFIMIGLTSSLLKESKEKILSLWEQRSISEVNSAGTGANLVLRDSIPLYVDSLCEALETNRKLDFKSVSLHEEEASRIGRMHGADRASNRSYNLTEVIFEYHILREVIFETLETHRPLIGVERDIILDSIEQAVNDAAVKFSEVHSDIQQRFINTLTHDLRSPLTAAGMNAQILTMDRRMPTECVAYAGKIIRNLNRLNSMILDLLDASRIRAGQQLELQYEQCDLNEIVADVVEEMIGMHGDRFVVDSAGALEGSWGCDGLKRTLENLLGNAVKFSTPDTPITISLRHNLSIAELSVHNMGPPIPESEIPMIFQQYRRSKTAGFTTGWGLGLTLVKGVVDAHKGTVRVESTHAKGTTFKIEIPLRKIEP